MRKIDFRWFLVVSGHRDPESRVSHQILRILVVGELRGMSFSDLMQNCATNRLRQVLLAPTITVESFLLYPCLLFQEHFQGTGEEERTTRRSEVPSFYSFFGTS